MSWFTKLVASVLGLVTFVRADVFDRSFLVRMEDITNTNKELSDTNKALNGKMANLTDEINELKMKNTEHEKTMTVINESLTNSSKFIPFVCFQIKQQRFGLFSISRSLNPN